MDQDKEDTQTIEDAKTIEGLYNTSGDICPNRAWALAESIGSAIAGLSWKTDENKMEDHRQIHDQCTFDFCEYSRRDFTAVAQLHEESNCTGKNLCARFWFEPKILYAAANNETTTAWKLDGKSMIKPYQPFMAISHVWSDGTGAGAWPAGQANECLYTFFKGVAEQFQCDGMWWDTICIPREKAARSKAISNMQTNYEDARITLVHDMFLRHFTWPDPETTETAEMACLAIILSPWFSRGWTALELAKSRKVKVVFKGTYGPVIKDLDEDILAKQKDSPSYRHQTATDIIASLRESRVKELDDLLTVLVPRHTSWPRDVAIISGLLVGVDISSEASQQKIYQNILNKIGKLSHGHLFHNTAKMSNDYCWCSTSLLTLPLASKNSSQVKSVEARLCVEKEGDIVGLWTVFELGDFQESIFIWKGTHRFLAATLRLALKDKKNYLLLIEPEPGPIRRAILVKVMTKRGETPEEVRCHFVGSVYFHSPQFTKEIMKNLKVRIGNTKGMEGVDGKALQKSGTSELTQNLRRKGRGRRNHLEEIMGRH